MSAAASAGAITIAGNDVSTGPVTDAACDRATTDDKRNAAESLMAALEAATPPETKLLWKRARELAWTGERCFKCDRVFGPDDVVFLTRMSLGRNLFGSYIHRVLPVCDACLSPWTRRAYLSPNSRRSPQPCEDCGRQIMVAHEYNRPFHLTCSERCKRACENQDRREQRAWLRGSPACAECGECFTPARADARYCSSACRQRAYRQRKVIA